VGVLQFDVTIARLKAEYGVDAAYEPVDFSVARWIEIGDRKKKAAFEKKYLANLARDAQGRLSFLTTSEWQLDYCMKEWPEVDFFKTRDIN
jgi:peptide chain release factor 3